MKKMDFILPLVILSTTLSADSGYFADGFGNAAWWTEHDIANIRIEVADSCATSPFLPGSFGVGGKSPALTNLTYNFHWPYTRTGQHFVVFIDGDYYSTVATYSAVACGSIVAIHFLVDSTNFEGNTTFTTEDGQIGIRSIWMIPGIGMGHILLVQEVSPMMLTMDADTAGLAKIKYMVYNNDVASHNIGLKLLIDVMTGWDDSPSIIVRNDTFEINRIYEFPMPKKWKTVPVDDSIVAMGIIDSLGASRPNVFAIGNIPSLENRIWICPHDPIDSVFWAGWIDSRTYDLAYVLQWDARSVAAGSALSCITYYGFGCPTGTKVSKHDKKRYNADLIVPNITTSAKMDISFVLPKDDFVSIDIIDILGKIVNIAVSGKFDAGKHPFTCDVANLTNGIYFVCLRASREIVSKKTLLLR